MKRSGEYLAKLTRRNGKPHRRGFILVVVTIVILLLSLAAYTYSGTMLVEYEAAAMHGRDVEARLHAESAIEFVATRILERDDDPTVDLYHDPAYFRGQTLFQSEVPRGQARFSIVTPDDTGTSTTGARFGLGNENAKYNLNKLVELDEDDDDLTDPLETLSYIPGMTEDIASAIMDWIDSDDERRVGGAETLDYQALAIAYAARNGPMESIDELLQIQGVTPQLFYGEDANRNGVLDPNENDGDASAPMDNADDVLDGGFVDYLTVTSQERNTMPDGEQKIDLNQGLMTELFDAVEAEFDTEAAKFIVAFRLTGSNDAALATTQSLTVDQEEAAGAIGKAVAGDVDGVVTRAGLDLTQTAIFSFRSIYDLIDAEVSIEVDGVPVTLTSPWTSNPGSLLSEMPELEQMLSVGDDAVLTGRINVNQARYAVLMTLPGMTETMATNIDGSRPPVMAEGGASSILQNRITPAWLLAEGLIDLETLRAIGPYLTTGGDVFRFQAVGHYDQGGPTTRLEAIIDATQSPPRIVFARDLSSLGRGFHPSVFTESGSQ
jgi:DNA uptake protein ComE-like DNA-binding protein